VHLGGDLVIQLVPTLNSRFVLEWAHGVPEGLVLSGAVANLGELFMGSIGDISRKPLAWQVLGGCTGNGKNNFRIGNQAKISVPYTPPAKLIKARILSDPQNGYTLTVNDNEITVTPRNPPVSYPCQVRVITNRGVRTLTFPPAQPLNDAESQALQTGLLGASLSCYYWEKQFTKIETIHWLVDPPFHVLRDGAVRQWQILVKGVDPSNTLTVRAPDGATVLIGRPSSSGALHFSLMFADQGGPQELTLELERPHDATAEPHEVSVRQTFYSLRASLPVQGKVRRIEVTGALREPHLAVTTDRQTLRWDVRNPLAPQLLEATTRHAVDEPKEQKEQDEGVLHNGRQLGGAATPNLTRALANLVSRLGHPQAVGNPRVLGFAETLYLRTAHGAAVYDISAPDQPQEIHTLSAPGWCEDTAASLNLMARHDRARQTIDLYEVAARHTV